MKTSQKILAFLSYLLFIPGWLFVLVFRRKDEHAKFHARQSLMINLFAFLLLVLWFVLTWLLIGILIIGPITACFLFAIVIAILIYLVIAWVMGMLRSFNPDAKPLPLVGNWALKLPF